MADVVIPAMSTVGDIISLLENSSLEWEYEYNPDQLVLYLEPGERIDVYYKGMEMFTIKSNNYMGDESTISLKDCLVTTIDVNEDNSQFFYYSKGYSGNGANVEDYTTFSNTYKDYDGYDESPSGDTISVKFHMPYATQQIESMGIDFGDQPLWVFANFSTADGTCVSFSYGDSLGFSWDKIE